jgi:hypothetical protein
MEQLAMRSYPYATDTNERKNVLLGLACMSILAAWILHSILSYVELVIPWWFDAPSVGGFLTLFYTAFDKWVWRKAIIRKLHLTRIPDLNGKWSGYIRSSFNEHSKSLPAKADIKQTWTEINVLVRTKSSESCSLTATITMDDRGASVLSYEYLNEPRPDADKTMHMHRGFTTLTLSDDGCTLSGPYYSGRDRQNSGLLHLERELKTSARAENK